ncbi:hypothetical protein [Scytonema hofmannii]|uniref:hypothetical protein n=1 Tax=Scytonema hofmannii TaxID=34078 RepID=UPI000345BE89|nr:hypothetical protein [Scytonema hofmannii]
MSPFRPYFTSATTKRIISLCNVFTSKKLTYEQKMAAIEMLLRHHENHVEMQALESTVHRQQKMPTEKVVIVVFSTFSKPKSFF